MRVDGDGDDRDATAFPVDAVARVRHVGLASPGVGLGRVDPRDHGGVEEELAGVGLLAVGGNLHVDVKRPPRVPAREDRTELRDAVCIRELDAAADGVALGALHA